MRDRLANPGAAGIYSDTSAASIYSDTGAAKRQVDSGNLVPTVGVRPRCHSQVDPLRNDTSI